MLKDRLTKQRRTRFLSWSIVSLAALSALSWMLWRMNQSEGSAPQPASMSQVDSNAQEPSPVWEEAEIASPSKLARYRSDLELTPGEVIDQPDCLSSGGAGAASKLGVVAVPGTDGSRFSVLNANGALVAGALPFAPNHLRLARRGDGSIMAGFGDLRLNQIGNLSEETPEPVRIFLNDQIIYENDKVWEFALAPDGSSFFVVEPLGGRTSRLVVSNLDEGAERHFDLGDRYASDGHHRPYSAFYTLDGQEIHLRPTEDTGAGVHYFFPAIGGNDPRRVRIASTGAFDRVLLVSSEEGYYSYSSDRDAPFHRIMKRRFDWSTGVTETVWERSIPRRIGVDGLQIDSKNAWLLFDTAPHLFRSNKSFLDSDWMYFVLNADSGEPVFRFPMASKEAQFERVASVLPATATPGGIGNIRDATFVDDQLFIYRVAPRVLDVFEMNTISLESPPDFRIPVNFSYDNRCASQTFPHSLQERNGRLVYAPRNS